MLPKPIPGETLVHLVRTLVPGQVPVGWVDFFGEHHDLSPREVEVVQADPGYRVNVAMTLTAPGCGMGQVLADDVAWRVRTVPGVVEANVELVFDPPWTPDRMSEAGRLELGMFF